MEILKALFVGLLAAGVTALPAALLTGTIANLWVAVKTGTVDFGRSAGRFARHLAFIGGAIWLCFAVYYLVSGGN